MKKIILTQGQYALVDDEDYEWLNQWKWYAHWFSCTKSFYADRAETKPGGGQRHVRMHRQILGLKHGDRRQVDHVEHNTLDNRKNKLRIVTHQQNSFNMYEVKGYYFNKSSGKFHAQIGVGGENKFLGRYNTTKEARTAYLEAKKKYHTISDDSSTARRPRLKLIEKEPRYILKGLY